MLSTVLLLSFPNGHEESQGRPDEIAVNSFSPFAAHTRHALPLALRQDGGEPSCVSLPLILVRILMMEGLMQEEFIYIGEDVFNDQHLQKKHDYSFKS